MNFVPMNLVRLCASLSIGAAIVACSSSSTQVDDAGLGASSSTGKSDGSSTSSGDGSSDESATGSDDGSNDESLFDGGTGCGRFPPCSDPTPVCCALKGFLSCVATGACMGVATNTGCKPGTCPTDQVCCGTLMGNGVQSTCQASCTGLGVEVCDPSGVIPSCATGFTCLPLGIIDRKTGYCSPAASLDGGLGAD